MNDQYYGILLILLNFSSSSSLFFYIIRSLFLTSLNVVVPALVLDALLG